MDPVTARNPSPAAWRNDGDRLLVYEDWPYSGAVAGPLPFRDQYDDFGFQDDPPQKEGFSCSLTIFKYSNYDDDLLKKFLICYTVMYDDDDDDLLFI